MKQDSFKEIAKLSPENLKAEVVKGKKTLLQFRFQKKHDPVKPHEIKAVRKKIARLKTILTLRKSESQKREIHA